MASSPFWMCGAPNAASMPEPEDVKTTENVDESFELSVPESDSASTITWSARSSNIPPVRSIHLDKPDACENSEPFSLDSFEMDTLLAGNGRLKLRVIDDDQNSEEDMNRPLVPKESAHMKKALLPTAKGNLVHPKLRSFNHSSEIAHKRSSGGSFIGFSVRKDPRKAGKQQARPRSTSNTKPKAGSFPVASLSSSTRSSARPIEPRSSSVTRSRPSVTRSGPSRSSSASRSRSTQQQQQHQQPLVVRSSRSSGVVRNIRKLACFASPSKGVSADLTASYVPTPSVASTSTGRISTVSSVSGTEQLSSRGAPPPPTTTTGTWSTRHGPQRMWTEAEESVELVNPIFESKSDHALALKEWIDHLDYGWSTDRDEDHARPTVDVLQLKRAVELLSLTSPSTPVDRQAIRRSIQLIYSEADRMGVLADDLFRAMYGLRSAER